MEKRNHFDKAWKYSIALLSLFFCCCTFAYSQTTARIEAIWQTHNVVTNNELGMNIHVKLSFTDMLNKAGWCAAYFYWKTDSVLLDKNQRYRAADGHVSTGKQFTPNIANGMYPDFILFIPYAELHLPVGQHDVKFSVTIFENTRPVAKSGLQGFQINWSQPVTPQSPQPSQSALQQTTQTQNTGTQFSQNSQPTYSLYTQSSSQQADRKTPFESEKRTAINVGVLMGGGGLIGADLEFLVGKRLGLQLGGGIGSMGFGINYHLKPYINSSFVSVQYWHQGFGKNHYASYLGPMYTFRARKILQIGIGFGTVLSKGPNWNMDKDTPTALTYNIGLFFPL